MTISKELLDELLSGVERPEDLLGDKGLMKELKVRLMERMLGAELTEHLGYEPHGEPASQQSNRRNGAARKVLKGNDGAVPIDIPRDRDGSFEPELIQKGLCQSRRKKGPFAGVKVGQLRCRALLGVLPIKLTRDKAHVGQRPTSIKFRPGSGSGVSALF